MHFSFGLGRGLSSPSKQSTKLPLINLKPCKVKRFSSTTWNALVQPWNWDLSQSCGHTISPLRSSKLMWAHPPDLSSMSLTDACCPIKSCTSQLLRYIVSWQSPTSVLTTCKQYKLCGNYSLSSVCWLSICFDRRTLCFFVCLTTWIKGVDTDSHINAREVIVVTFMSEKAVVWSVSQKGIWQEKAVRERELASLKGACWLCLQPWFASLTNSIWRVRVIADE